MNTQRADTDRSCWTCALATRKPARSRSEDLTVPFAPNNLWRRLSAGKPSSPTLAAWVWQEGEFASDSFSVRPGILFHELGFAVLRPKESARGEKQIHTSLA